MKKNFARFAFASAMICNGAVLAQEPGLTTIDDPQYALDTRNNLLAGCSNGPVTDDEKKKCLVRIASVANRISIDLSTYINNNSPGSFLERGESQGELLIGCEKGLKAVFHEGGFYPSTQAYARAAMNVTKECMASISRAEQNVGVSFQPTAYNTVADLVNHLNYKLGQ